MRVEKMSDDNNGGQHRKMITTQRQRVNAVRSQFAGEGVYAELSEDTHLQLARVAVEYWQLLREYKDEAVVEEFPDISPLRSRLGKETQILSKSAGLNRGMVPKPKPAVLEVGIDEILGLLDELDNIANRLGFSTAATEKLPNDRASEDDLKTLLEARGQSEAVDNLPGEQEADD